LLRTLAEGLPALGYSDHATGKSGEYGTRRYRKSDTKHDRSHNPPLGFRRAYRSRTLSVKIAKQWQAVAAYASALGAESDVDDGAPIVWSPAGKPGAAGWGFEGSVGAGRGPAEFEALEGLREGFREL
jgi:hypothetical protein